MVEVLYFPQRDDCYRSSIGSANNLFEMDNKLANLKVDEMLEIGFESSQL